MQSFIFELRIMGSVRLDLRTAGELDARISSLVCFVTGSCYNPS
jgi:hypothetical protein